MDLNAEEAKRELATVLASPAFRASPKLSSLLDYLFANQEPGSLTQTVIAAEFFGRSGSEYDPKADSQVRTEIRRLRLKLAEYYMNEGSAGGGRLEIPKGAYEVIWRAPPAATATPAPANLPPRRFMVLGSMALAMGLTALTVTLGLGLKSETPHSPPRTVAILPFGGSTLPDTVSDDLSRRLTRSKALRVTASHSAAGFRERTESLAAIGKKLWVEGIVEGSVQARPGDELTIEARLTDLRSGRELWSRKVGGPAQELPQLEDDLSAALLTALALPAVPPPYRPKPEALNLYIRGMQNMRRAQPDVQNALDQFARAARIDPGFSAAEVSEARVYLVQTNNGSMEPAIGLPRAEAAIRRALKADPESSEAHTALGNLYYARHAWQSARSEYETAIELDQSSATSYTSLAMLLTILGRFDEAERELRHAIALDPLWHGPHQTLAELYYYARRYDQSYEAAEQFAQLFPGMSGASFKARDRRRQGRNDEAVRNLAELPTSPLGEVFKAICEGDRGRAFALLRSFEQKKQYISAWSHAAIAMELGDREGAIGWLEKSLAAGEPDLCSLNVDPLFDAIRGDVRCRRILSQLNLPAKGLSQSY